MLSLFRTNQFFANAFLLIYVLIIWSPAFIVPQEYVQSNGAYLFDSLSNYLPDPGTAANYFIAAIIALLQAVLINFMVSKYRLTEEITLFPGLFYILFLGFSSQFWSITPQLLANFFLLFTLYQLIDTYKEYSSADRIFNIGLFIGIASLFYFSYLVFLLFAWIGIGILRAMRWKERVILIIGFFSPYFLVGTYEFWQGQFIPFWQNDIVHNFNFFNFVEHEGFNDIVTFVLISIVLCISIFSYKSYTYKKKIKIQKIIDILYWILSVTTISLIFQSQINVQHLLMLIPILAIFASINFVQISRQWSEMLHLLLFAGLLIWHFLPLLNI